MKKKIVLAASALVITAGSLFAFSGTNSSAALAAGLGEPCMPGCCIDPNECEASCEAESSCCMMIQE